MIVHWLVNAMALLVMPFVMVGVLQRVKALWSGRKGPKLVQPVYDVIRLLRKDSVYSTTTTFVFRLAPYVFLVTAVGSALIAPLLGARPILSFPLDFVWFAYVWALGRGLLVLAALDTGSAFEGMGAAREATFSALLEPVLFLVVGCLGLLSHTTVLSDALAPRLADSSSVVIWCVALGALIVALQVESARMPIDDPTTHLELTMIHEVMVLDHSGPELAAIQVGSSIKLFVGASFIATLLNPFTGQPSVLCAATNLGLCVLVAVGIGTTESLIARLKLRAIPQYIAVALLSGVIALLAVAFRVDPGP